MNGYGSSDKKKSDDYDEEEKNIVVVVDKANPENIGLGKKKAKEKRKKKENDFSRWLDKDEKRILWLGMNTDNRRDNINIQEKTEKKRRNDSQKQEQ